LIRERCHGIIVRILDIMSMSVGTRKITKDGKKCHTCDKATNIAQDDFDSEVVLLMATTSERYPMCEDLYLDFGCSNHITGHK